MWLSPVVAPVVLGALAVATALCLAGRSPRRLLDVIGGVIVLRALIGFGVLNILLLVPIQRPALLIIQLLLFLPAITLLWGWIYWRFDQGARARGSRMIVFDDNDEDPDLFDYFYAAGHAVVSFEPYGMRGAGRRIKLLSLLHGLMMLDLMGLTLSRALSLAAGS